MNNTLPDSVKQRIKAAASILTGYRTEDQITEALVKLGVESEGDLNPEWIERGRLLNLVGLDDKEKPTPEIKAKKAVAALYGSQTAATSARTEELKAAGIAVKAKDAPVENLLKLYRPELSEDPITRFLKDRFNSRKVILFVPGTSDIDVQATIDYIADLEQGYAEQEFVQTSGGLARPVAVGEKADKIVDEDPLNEGQPLRKDRSVVGFPANWTGIATEVRKLCRIIVDRNDVDTNNRHDVNSLIMLAMKGFDTVKEVYPEAAVQYRELEAIEKLPTLRITLNGVGRANNPFSVGKKRSY